MSISAQHCARRSANLGIRQVKQIAAAGTRVRLKVNVPATLRRNRMKSRKLCAVVVGSLVALAMSVPVMAQEVTQSTTTTTQPPD